MKEHVAQQRKDITSSSIQPGTTKRLVNRLTEHQKRILRYTGAGLCFLSELIHLWLLPEQYEMFIGYGIVFLLIAMAQGWIGANLLFEPHRRLLRFGLWINTLTIVLYGFTHTIGVLVGLAFLPLSIDVWGIGATTTEIVVVIFLLLLQRDAPRIRRNMGRRGTAKSKKIKERSEQ